MNNLGGSCWVWRRLNTLAPIPGSLRSAGESLPMSIRISKDFAALQAEADVADLEAFYRRRQKHWSLAISHRHVR